MSDVLREFGERLARVEENQKSQGAVLEKIDGKLDRMDERLGSVERTSAIVGSLAGSIVSVGVSYISTKLKTLA